jgi:putative restriction endonuclease
MIDGRSPDAIQTKHVIAAAVQWARDGKYLTFHESTRYDVLIGGKRYPPKAICSIAVFKATGEILESTEFKGAKNGPWHTRLTDLGFPIRSKRVRQSGSPTGTVPKARLSKALETLASELPKIVVNQTDVEAIVKRRMHTGKLRKLVLQTFDRKCCLTGVAMPQLLICSHIHPWSISNHEERVDPENTLLLAANWDALFDRHLITFTPRGQVIVAKAIERGGISKLMGLDVSACLDARWLTPKRLQYLAAHRKRFKETDL